MLSPNEKRSQLVPSGPCSVAWKIASEAIDAATSTTFELRLPCHSGITRDVGDWVRDDMIATGWTVTFVELRESDPSLDQKGFEGSVLVYSVSG